MFFHMFFHMHTPSSVSKCDFSTDNGNYNKDTKPLWCDFFLDSEVQPNQKLHSVRGLKKLNSKFTYTNLY